MLFALGTGSTTDVLTGIANHAVAGRRVQVAVSQSGRTYGSLALGIQVGNICGDSGEKPNTRESEVTVWRVASDVVQRALK
jgi:hypothetical protein